MRVKSCLLVPRSFSFLVEDTLAKLRYTRRRCRRRPGPFDQWSDVSITLATERQNAFSWLVPLAGRVVPLMSGPLAFETPPVGDILRDGSREKDGRLGIFLWCQSLDREPAISPSPTSIWSHCSHVRSGGASLSPVVTCAALETDAAHFLYPVIHYAEWRPRFAELRCKVRAAAVAYAPHNRPACWAGTWLSGRLNLMLVFFSSASSAVLASSLLFVFVVTESTPSVEFPEFVEQFHWASLGARALPAPPFSTPVRRAPKGDITANHNAACANG